MRSVAGAVMVHTVMPAAWPLLEVLALVPVLQQRSPLPQASHVWFTTAPLPMSLLAHCRCGLHPHVY